MAGLPSDANFFAVVRQTLGSEGGVTVREALRILEENTAATGHEFWPQLRALPEILPEIRERLIGHQQLVDAVLLDLAIAKRGKLATLDRRIGALLPTESEHRSALEIVPV